MSDSNEIIHLTQEVISCPFGANQIFDFEIDKLLLFGVDLPFQENESKMPDYNELNEYDSIMFLLDSKLKCGWQKTSNK
jgi:hypothetical protein